MTSFFRIFIVTSIALCICWTAAPRADGQAIATRPTSKTNVRAVLEQSREILNKYYETEQLIAKERADWQLSKELLEDRIQLVKDQLKELREKTAEEEKNITKADEDREKLVAEADELKALQSAQQTLVKELESSVRSILNIAPEGLAAKIQALVDRLPDADDEQIKASIGERFATILGILNETNKFAADLAVFNERRQITPELEAEVETLYLGLAKAYFAGGEGPDGPAGIGSPGPEGWVWSPAPKARAAIQSMLTMQSNATSAAFVAVPVQVNVGGESQ